MSRTESIIEMNSIAQNPLTRNNIVVNERYFVTKLFQQNQNRSSNRTDWVV